MHNQKIPDQVEHVDLSKLNDPYSDPSKIKKQDIRVSTISPFQPVGRHGLKVHSNRLP